MLHASVELLHLAIFQNSLGVTALHIAFHPFDFPPADSISFLVHTFDDFTSTTTSPLSTCAVGGGRPPTLLESQHHSLVGGFKNRSRTSFPTCKARSIEGGWSC